ncbi:polysaccharide deacetylase [Pedobacter lusitanus]|uniref:Polysaccharide deacetylase n=1 Tax=Pedobacter lusitanus TaxID=1503925 RepID=A0A0D0GFP0_9SPHI|nr:polysaccharide deacetylase family protein [Pedobacter lusitanus]KIO74955.1 polysaccharide deacetylase [Pedobacter lusitanus]
MYLVKSPLLLKWYYPSLVWNKSRSDKVIYLTFDDGPIPVVTDFVLNTLKSFNCKATFFCIGDNINKHAEIFEQVKNDGHAIGNHTLNHLKGWITEDKTYIKNFQDCQKLTNTNLFRPPYGRIKKSQIKELRKINPQLNIIMWDVLSGDFDLNLSPEKCYENVIKNTRNGSIIVFHDSLKAFDRLKFALPATLKFLTAQGYKFHTL